MLLGQVEDAHRLAHVEDEDLAALAHGPGLQHELRRLRDGHEVALHVRVGDRHRPAVGDLVPEDRDHRAGRAEHVAEAHGEEAGRRGGAGRGPGPPARRHASWRPSPTSAAPPCRSRSGRTPRLPHSAGQPADAPRCPGRCSAPPRPGCTPSAARACGRRRGRPRPAPAARRGSRAPASRRRRRPPAAPTARSGPQASAARGGCRRGRTRRAPAAAAAPGWKRAIWRASSDADRAAGAGDHHRSGRPGSARGAPRPGAPASRPRRSSISTSRKRVIATLPWSTSKRPGMIRTLRRHAAQISTIRRMSAAARPRRW